jgi:hypothetical protein
MHIFKFLICPSPIHRIDSRLDNGRDLMTASLDPSILMANIAEDYRVNFSVLLKRIFLFAETCQLPMSTF